MKFLPTPLPGSYLVDLTPFGDERGWFARTYCKNEFREIGFVKEWVQINHSFSKDVGKGNALPAAAARGNKTGKMHTRENL